MVLAFRQRCGWRELPATTLIHNSGANQLAVVININTAARLCGTFEGWVRVIGGAAAAEIATAGAHVICRKAHDRFFRCHGIHRDIEGWRRNVVTRRVFGHYGQAVIALSKILFWRERPVAIRIYNGRAQNVVAIFDGHGAAWLAFTAQFRTHIIGHVAWLQVTHDRALIVHHFTYGDLVWIRIDGEGDARRRFTGVA